LNLGRKEMTKLNRLFVAFCGVGLMTSPFLPWLSAGSKPVSPIDAISFMMLEDSFALAIIFALISLPAALMFLVISASAVAGGAIFYMSVTDRFGYAITRTIGRACLIFAVLSLVLFILFIVVSSDSLGWRDVREALSPLLHTGYLIYLFSAISLSSVERLRK
jgi:hypothetical protein